MSITRLVNGNEGRTVDVILTTSMVSCFWNNAVVYEMVVLAEPSSKASL